MLILGLQVKNTNSFHDGILLTFSFQLVLCSAAHSTSIKYLFSNRETLSTIRKFKKENPLLNPRLATLADLPILHPSGWILDAYKLVLDEVLVLVYLKCMRNEEI